MRGLIEYFIIKSRLSGSVVINKNHIFVTLLNNFGCLKIGKVLQQPRWTTLKLELSTLQILHGQFISLLFIVADNQVITGHLKVIAYSFSMLCKQHLIPV